MATILVVDDSPEVLSTIERTVRAADSTWRIFCVNGGSSARAMLARGHVDVLVTDLRMPLMDGFSLIHYAGESSPVTVPIVLSAHIDVKSRTRLSAAGINYLEKPVESARLVHAIKDAIMEATLQKAKKSLLETFDKNCKMDDQQIPKILFVDDDPEVLSGLKRALRDRSDGWSMTFLCGAGPAVDLVHKEEFDILVTDMAMPLMNGWELMDRISSISPKTDSIVLSGHCDTHDVDALTEANVIFLGKPASSQAIVAVIQDALDHRWMRMQSCAFEPN